MSDLTREEIRSACEAVGWERQCVDLGRLGTCEFYLDAEHEESVFCDDRASRWAWKSNAIALLEATGEQWITGRTEDGRFFAGFVMPYPNSDDLEVYGPDLPTAAVRAVNAWKEGKQ